VTLAHKHPKQILKNIFFKLGIKLALFFVGFVLLLPDTVAAKDSFGLNAAQVAKVKKAQNYLNKMTTLKAKFIQVTSRGGFARGELWISVPGRMRFDYDPPLEVVIVSDGRTVLFKDDVLDQLSYIAFDATPASILLGGRVDFFGPDVLLTDFEHNDGTVRITVVRKEDPAEGSLTMVFNASNMALIKWMIIDAQGIATTVSLLEPSFGGPIDEKLFKVEQRTFAK
ncbi:MAG: outer membrane lipoprotein carrier protein LolA, partial [Rhodospirillaceae bacterium]|nr:outer membrane lipoprotein carrier protein LolA [Rhodospirillaceae bacterium]